MRPLFHLNKYLLKYKRLLILGTLFVTISVVFRVFLAYFVGESFNDIELHLGGNDTELEELKSALLEYGLIIIGAAILQGAFMFLMRQTIIVMSRHIEFDLKNEVFNHYQKLSIAFYKRNNTGDLMNRISEDVSRVRMYIGPAIMYTINMVILTTIIVGRMIYVDVSLTLLTLIPLPLLAWSVYKVSDMINKRSTIVQEQLSVLSTFTQETFSGIRVLKAYTKEDQWTKDYEEESLAYHNKNKGLYTINALFFPLMIFLIGISVLLVVFFGGHFAINGQGISTGVIAEFIIYVNMLTWPIASIGWVTSIIQRAAASQARINEFLDEQPEITNNQENSTPIKGSIAFQSVSFTYPDSGIQALKDVSFQVNQGETVAIIGKTGSGKSTIASLVGRLYDPTSGSVKVDGEELFDLNLNNLRQSIGYVPQEGFLFSETISNNIGFGKSDATHDEIVEAAKIARVHENILDFPDQYDTKVGERGVTLSGGQKQRVSIARAIIGKPNILIFDDCLSAVDTETEEYILQNLKRISKDTTTIIISHRVSSVKHADTILVLKEGVITESGDHKSLVNRKGYYAELYNKQLVESQEKVA
ncbi:MAG: ABC transporter ATP-binding protein/permease [Schleiferiaceae bacterium]|nr:ABC transporter ATP-binding protein/permease [Schleiferiaceae bacterium]